MKVFPELLHDFINAHSGLLTDHHCNLIQILGKCLFLKVTLAWVSSPLVKQDSGKKTNNYSDQSLRPSHNLLSPGKYDSGLGNNSTWQNQKHPPRRTLNTVIHDLILTAIVKCCLLQLPDHENLLKWQSYFLNRAGGKACTLLMVCLHKGRNAHVCNSVTAPQREHSRQPDPALRGKCRSLSSEGSSSGLLKKNLLARGAHCWNKQPCVAKEAVSLKWFSV